MFTSSFRRRRSPSARRQLLAVATAAFITLQPMFFASPASVAQKRESQEDRISAPPQAPKLLTGLGVPVTQSFDTLPASGSATWTNNSTLIGWFHARTGTGTTIVANDGSSNAGNLYSYGTGTATDRALGSLGSGNAAIGNLFWGVRLQNGTGSTVTQLDVSYVGEQWRNSAAAAQTVAFSYLVGSPTVTGSLAEFQSAGVAVTSLDFTSPITGGAAGALNGNLAANRVTKTFSITGLSIPNGTEIMLRWSDPDHTGADHGMSIDDFSVTPQGAAPLPNLTVTDVSQAETNAGTTTFTFQVNLSAPAGPGGVTFDIATADGTAQDDNPVAEDNDYVAQSLTGQTIAAGNSSFAFNVLVNGDLFVEANETFFVNVTNVTGANITDGQGQGTIQNDDAACASLSITDVSQAETDAGTTTFAFTVSLSQAGCGTVTFDIATADGTAQDDNPGAEDNDYVPQSLTGQTITFSSTYTFNVAVNGDAITEPDETFFVNITNVSPGNVLVTDGQGLGTIVNDDFTRIHDIQGPGGSSPLSGSVTTRGIVTGRKSNGFFIQEPDATVDANPLTSEGIFVFTSAAPPAAAALGNLVEVAGTIFEFVPIADLLQPPLTELTSPTTVQLSTGNPLPAAIPLNATFPDPAGPFDQLERLEGMRVSVSSLTVSGPTLGNTNEANATSTSTGVFFGVVTGVARPFREPGIQDPDPAPSGSIPPIPRFDANPEMLRVDSDGLTGGTILDVGTGAVVTGLIGPLDYGFRHYTILPDPSLPAPVAAGGPTATSGSVPTGREFTVASYNLERFFDTVNDPGIGEPVLTATAFDNRLNKASLGIRNHLRNPDILGIVEIENLSTLQALAARISADAVAAAQPDPEYDAFLVEGNDVGGIDVGFLVKTAVVTGAIPRVTVNAVVQENAGELFVNPDSSTSLLNDRPSLRLDAVINHANGASFPLTVIVNHLRSLTDVNSIAAGSSGWPTDGERVRAKRLKQAESLANLVQARQTSDPLERIILVGDFNAYEFNDGLVDMMNVIQGTPVPDNQTAVPGDGVDLVNPDLDNLFDTPPAPERYSYIFDGQAQNLDHVVVNGALTTATTAQRVEHPRINADFPAVDRNDANTPRRLSDHDPIVGYFEVAGFAIADISITKVEGADPVTAGTNLSYTITVTNDGPDAAENASWSDTLPAGTTFVSMPAVAGWTCTTGAIVSCSNPSFAVGSAVFTLTVAVSSSVPGGTVLTNTAAVTSTTADPDTVDQSATEMTTVAAAPLGNPTISTQASAGGVIGTQVNDVATLAGGNAPTGTVTFRLFSDAECVNQVFTSTNPLSGVSATSDNFSPSAPGTYFWTAVYSGDSNNNGATSPCGAANESVTITQASPTISTQASPGGPLSTFVNDVATLTGGFSPTGTVTFRLFSDTECSAQVFTSTNPLSGGTATSDFYTPLATGTYYWTAVYSGDANNTSATSPCGAPNESVTIASTSDLTIAKTHSGNFSAGQVGASYTITVSNVGASPTDGSTVTVTDNVPTGLTPTGPVGIHNGWFCSIASQTLTCSRSDVLAGNSSYPSITLTVNVANPAPVTVTNTATVSSVSESNTQNNSASDVTNINCESDPSQTNNNPLVISRFRMNGPMGARDEFVEVFNPTDEDYTVASGNCTGGLGVFASAGNGTTSNGVSMVCQIPNGTQIPARGYFLCTGVTYSLNKLGLNGGPEGANATGDAPIGCGGSCSDNIPNDAGLALIDVASNIVTMCPKGAFGCPTGFSFSSPSTSGIAKVYDSVGFSPYGPGAPGSAYPSLAGNFCEGDCLKPVGDASTGGGCTENSMFPVTAEPPACYGQAGQYEFLRRQTTFDANLGTLHQDSNNNVNDIILVAPNSAANMGLQVTGVSGVTSVLGASVPQNSNAPVDIPRTEFTQAPFDGADQLGPRNAERNYTLDPTIANTANDPLGTFVLRLRYTNNSGEPVTPMRFRVDNLSTLCGPQNATPAVGTGNARNLSTAPECGAAALTAILKVVNSTAETVVDSGVTAQFVYGTVLEDLSVGPPGPPGPLSPLGGGVDNTVALNPSNDGSSVGDGVTGGVGQYNSISFANPPANVLRMRIKFGVVQSGRFILLLTPQAKFGPTPLPGIRSGDKPKQ